MIKKTMYLITAVFFIAVIFISCSKFQSNVSQDIRNNRDIVRELKEKQSSDSSTIYFKSDSYDLDIENQDFLIKIAQSQAASKNFVYLIGHTDRVGGSNYNLNLSKKRVESVKQYLVSLGIAQDLINIKFLGDQAPVDSNNSPEAYSKNRRVEIFLIREPINEP